MPWIINVCRDDVKRGKHPISDHCMLIQIADPPGDFPEPKHTFAEVHQFQFLDVEEDTEVLDEEMRCSYEQANELVQLLQHAIQNGMDVVVHCFMGWARSGAVASIGEKLGFEYIGPGRGTNGCVYNRMSEAINLLCPIQIQASDVD